MFQFLFLEAVGRRTGCSRDSVLNLYNSSCGRPTAGMRAALKSEVGRILEVLLIITTTPLLLCLYVLVVALACCIVPLYSIPLAAVQQLQCNVHAVHSAGALSTNRAVHSVYCSGHAHTQHIHLLAVCILYYPRRCLRGQPTLRG
jgi:hypothetical protein